MPRYKPHTRESIERIRETIDTKRAVQTLNEIGHDDKVPPSTRVKALQVLLDKTLPSLTQADILNQPAETIDYSALIVTLKELLGPEHANKLLAKLGHKPDAPGTQSAHATPESIQ